MSLPDNDGFKDWQTSIDPLTKEQLLSSGKEAQDARKDRKFGNKSHVADERLDNSGAKDEAVKIGGNAETKGSQGQK